MAKLSNTTGIFSGDTAVIDTIQKHKFGTRAFDVDSNEYIYLTGCATTVLGSWVTFDEAGLTTLLAGTSVGPVAVAMAILDSTSEYGWYCIYGECEADFSATVTDNTAIGYETAAGHAGDGHAGGDQIYGAVIRDTVTTAGTATAQLNYPFVDDNSN